MFTKTQIKIMQVFVSEIDSKFSIKKVSEIIKKPYPLVHRSISSLIKDGYISRDKHNLLSISYRKNQQELAYIESLRKEVFLNNNKTVQLFRNDVFEKIKLDFFIFLIFGSSVKSKKHANDIDILIIIEDKSNLKNIDKILQNIASNFSLDFDINLISAESVYEMLIKREELNVMNETLNNHIILFGAENYYQMLKNAR